MCIRDSDKFNRGQTTRRFARERQFIRCGSRNFGHCIAQRRADAVQPLGGGGLRVEPVSYTHLSVTVLDKSLESKLGRCFWTHRLWHEWYGVKVVKLFRAPKLYLGNTQLPTGCWIHTADLSIMSSERNRILHTNRQIMGVLGMDCLKYYCIQLDFAADKMCFLDPEHSNQQDWGKAFPLTAFNSGCFSVRENLTGVKGPGSLIDAGCNFDGWLTPKPVSYTHLDVYKRQGRDTHPSGRSSGN